RFVFREMPILSANSNDIARWSLASHEQGKYFEFHAALMNHRGSRNAETMKKIAKDVGLDPEQLEKDANSSDVKAALEESVKVAREVGIQGTPAFIINGELYPGYLGPEGLKRAVESARQKL
ncbi:MAG: DsbA family protein, partial [Pseudomonadota bacterium]